MARNPIEELNAQLEKLQQPSKFEVEAEKKKYEPAPPTVKMLASRHEERRYTEYKDGPIITYVACPLCGLNRVLEKKGTGHDRRTMMPASKMGQIRFNKINLETGWILQEREATQKGFPMVSSENFKVLIEKYPELAGQIKQKCREILSYFS